MMIYSMTVPMKGDDGRFHITLKEGSRDNSRWVKDFSADSEDQVLHDVKVWSFEEATDMRVHADGPEAVDQAMAERYYFKPEGVETRAT